MPTYFTPDYLKFFIDLASHNNKEWFDKNRDRYMKSVKGPFEKFVEKLITELRKTEEIMDGKPGDFIFRINRDIRFSKDKTPYKTQMSAAISKGGKKDMVNIGVYFELGPEHIGIYTGVYLPDKVQIDSIRHYIAKNAKKFDTIVKEKNFKATFGEVKGEKAKLLPPDLKAAAATQPVIFNKQFYLQHHGDADIIVEKDVLKYITDKYKHAKAFNDFLKQAL